MFVWGLEDPRLPLWTSFRDLFKTQRAATVDQTEVNQITREGDWTVQYSSVHYFSYQGNWGWKHARGRFRVYLHCSLSPIQGAGAPLGSDSGPRLELILQFLGTNRQGCQTDASLGEFPGLSKEEDSCKICKGDHPMEKCRPKPQGRSFQLSFGSPNGEVCKVCGQ